MRITKKTTIFLSVSLLAVQASAQEYYHDGTRITADGITFNPTTVGQQLL